MASSGPLKLHYFAFPGRAEVARQLLAIGNIPHENVNIERADWPAAKSKFPFGQVPVLEFPDGRMLAQSGAIETYLAKLAGLYPSDPYEAALVDQVRGVSQDLWTPIMALNALPLDERVAERQKLLAPGGKVAALLAAISKGVEAQAGGYVAGGKLSLGDLILFSALTSLITGNMDGIPTTLLDAYPALKAYRNKIASEPPVKAFYEQHSEGMRAAYKPDA